MTAMDAYSQQAVSGLLDRLSRMARGMQFCDGLNPAQWESLRFLACANRHSRTPGALAVFLGSTKGTASQTVMALEAKGLVRRVRDADDRRVSMLQVTDEGASLLERDPLAGLEQALACLSPDECAALARGLGALVQELTERRGWRSFGVCNRCGHFQGHPDGSARCGLLSETVRLDDTTRMCVDFRPCGERTAKRQ